MVLPTANLLDSPWAGPGAGAVREPRPLRQADGVAGDRAVREELAHLVDGRVRERQDVLRRHDLVGGQRCAHRMHQGHRGVQGGGEGGVLVVADGGVEVLVQRGQLRGGVTPDAELTLAEDPDDHDPSPACSAAAASCPAGLAPLPSICRGALAAISPFIRASSESTSLLAPILSSSAWMASWPPLTWSSRAPEASSSSMAPARACICAVLSSARWMARPTSPISSEIPEKASLIRVCASAAV